jgi:putative hydrolase of the HAD superfamily
VRIKAVIFDLDDTLMPELDYVRSGFRACAALLGGQRGEGAIYDELMRLFDEDRRMVFDRYCASHGLPEETARQCLTAYREHAPTVSLGEEAERILAWLRENGFLLGLLTDGRPEGQRAKIKALGLTERMDYMVVTDELGGPAFRKPNSLGYETVLRGLGALPQEAMYVADNPAKDFLAPNAMGMASVLYTGASGLYAAQSPAQNAAAQYTIERLEDLKRIVFLL